MVDAREIFLATLTAGGSAAGLVCILTPEQYLKICGKLSYVMYKVR